LYIRTSRLANPFRRPAALSLSSDPGRRVAGLVGVTLLRTTTRPAGTSSGRGIAFRWVIPRAVPRSLSLRPPASRRVAVGAPPQRRRHPPRRHDRPRPGRNAPPRLASMIGFRPITPSSRRRAAIRRECFGPGAARTGSANSPVRPGNGPFMQMNAKWVGWGIYRAPGTPHLVRSVQVTRRSLCGLLGCL
jgi:hypothetical protein